MCNGANVMSIVKASYSVWRNYIIQNNNKLFQTFNNDYQIKQCVGVLSLSAKRRFTDLRETIKQLSRSGECTLTFLLCKDLTLNLKVDDFITSVFNVRPFKGEFKASICQFLFIFDFQVQAFALGWILNALTRRTIVQGLII